MLAKKVRFGTASANREYFEEHHATLFEHLTNGKGAIKMCCEVADL